MVRRGVSRAEANGIVRDFVNWPVVDSTLALPEAAMNEQSRWEIPLWDALILAAVRACGASELITEDLSHVQSCGGVNVVNPFL